MSIVSDVEILLRANVARLQQDLTAARNQVSGAMGSISNMARGAGAALAGLAAGLSVAVFAGWIKGAIDAADAASKLSARTGVAVKDIAGLQLAFDLGGAGGDAFANTMTKLSKQIVEGGGALAALQIKTTATGGALRSNRDVLYDVADAFAKMDNGARKTAMAVELFGKSGAELIPLLNGGAAGFRDMEEMAQKLGLTMSTETAASAEAFNDNLDLLMMGSQGVARQIAAEMLPTLSSLSGALLDSMTSGDKLKKTADFLGAGLKILFTIGVGIVEVFSAVGKTIGAAGAQVVAIMNGDFKAAAAIGRDWSNDMATSWSDTAKTISAAWSNEGNAAMEAQAKTIRAQKDYMAAQKDKEAAAKKAQQAQEAAAKKAESEYAASVKAADDFITAMKQEAVQLGMNAAQVKDMAAQRAAAKAPTQELKDAILAEAAALAIATQAQELKVKAEASALAISTAYYAGLAKSVADIDAQIAATKEQIAAYGMTEQAVVDLALAKAAAAMAAGPATIAELIALDAQIAKLKELQGLTAQKTALEGGGPGVQQAKDMLEIMAQVDEATKSAAASMASSFGSVGAAIGGLTTALSGYGRMQAAIAAQLAADRDKNKNDPAAMLKAEVAAAKAGAQARVKSYGDMAGAAKGFFKENTTGYKVMEGTEKAFRAFEMAMALKSMAVSLFTSATKATGAVAGQAVETTAVASGEAARNIIKIPGVIMSFMSAMGPWGLAAAGLAIGAVMGGAFGGVGGGGAATPTFKDTQEKQGTGTVLGDATAKSESISKSLDMMSKNSSIELTYQNSMLMALRNIETALGGAAKGILQTAGLTGGSAFGTVNDATKSFFGADTSTTIMDTGVRFAGRLGALQGSQYEDVTKKSDGGWFHGNSTRNTTNTKALEDAAMKPFELIFSNMGKLLVGAGEKLGVDGAALTNAINNIVIDFAVSTRELNGQDLVDALSAGVSSAFDKLTTSVFPYIAEFQKMGEGLGETLVRIASNYQALDVALNNIGMTVGAVGVGSIAARERLIELAGGIDKLADQTTFFADNFLTEAERIAPLQKFLNEQLAAMGKGSIKTAEDFKAAVQELQIGGQLATAAGAQMFTNLMALAPAFKQVSDFMVQSQKAADDLAAADLAKSLEDAANAAQRMADATAAATAATAAAAAAAAAATAAINAENTRQKDAIGKLVDTTFAAVGRAVNAQKNTVTKAYQDSMAALQDRIESLNGSIAKTRSLSDALKQSLGGMTVAGSDGAARSAAQAQITAALALAKSNGILPGAEDLKGALATLSRDSVNQFGSYADYVRGMARTASDIAQLGAVADRQLSTEEMQLAAMLGQKAIAEAMYTAEITRLDGMLLLAQQQIDATKGVDNTVMSVVAALAGFNAARAGAANPVMIGAGGATTGLSVEELYRQALGREGAASGIAFWKSAFGDAVDSTEMQSFLKGAAPELTAKSEGNWESWLASKGVTNPVYTSQQSGTMTGGNAAMLTELQTLNKRMEKVETNTGQFAAQFDTATAGGGPLLVTTTNPVAVAA